MEFSAAAVAAGLENDVMWRRTVPPGATGPVAAGVWRANLARWDRRRVLWLRPRALPGGALQRLTAARRVYLHRQIGIRVEAGYGARAGDIAAELAMHFEQGRDYCRAVTYLRQAADNALRRYANREAIHHLTKGLALLNALPATPERTQQELDLLLPLGPSLMAVKGYGAPEVERTYAQALTLCQQTGETHSSSLRWGLQFYVLRGELQKTRALGERLIRWLRVQDLDILLAAHYRQGVPLFCGELTCARAHLEQALPSMTLKNTVPRLLLYGMNPRGDPRLYGYVLWLLGYAEQALERGIQARFGTSPSAGAPLQPGVCRN